MIVFASLSGVQAARMYRLVQNTSVHEPSRLNAWKGPMDTHLEGDRLQMCVSQKRAFSFKQHPFRAQRVGAQPSVGAGTPRWMDFARSVEIRPDNCQIPFFT